MTKQNYSITLSPPSGSPWSPKKGPEKQVAVLLSGGVDSSVCAQLLTQAGYDVLAITMKIPVFGETSNQTDCYENARTVCRKLNIAHYLVDLKDAFEKIIVEPFRTAYAQGKTPNPCVECNANIKLALIWDFIRSNFGVELIATGHYAKIVKTENSYRLAQAKDKTKDQSYFLSQVPAEKLSRLILPLGQYTKEQTRQLALRFDLPVSDSPESMELCFADQKNYRILLPDTQANQPGDLTDMNGKKIGTHKGISNYTIGQRRGLGFAAGHPLYVGKIDAEKNIVALGTKEQVSQNTITAENINALIPEELIINNKLLGKIRSYGQPHRCKVDAIEKNSVTITFDKPLFAPSPGQKLVLYNHLEHMVAAGTIAPCKPQNPYKPN